MLRIAPYLLFLPTQSFISFRGLFEESPCHNCLGRL